MLLIISQHLIHSSAGDYLKQDAIWTVARNAAPVAGLRVVNWIDRP